MTSKLISAALAIAVVATAARGQNAPAAADTPTLAGPSFPGWTAKPGPMDMARAAPPAAMNRDISGVTILFCTVGADGRLKDCRIQSETPTGWGFGQASLGLVPLFRMKLTKPDGAPVGGGTVRIPIRFIPP